MQRWEVEVLIVDDGQQAVEALQDKGFDLMLMDIRMPRLDGYQATRCIRALEEPRLTQVPIIALTASALPEEVTEMTAARFDTVVVKPFRPQHLMAQMTALLPQRYLMA